MDAANRPAHILVIGGGYVGTHTAPRLQARLKPNWAEITVVDPQSNMTYQPFLPEAAAGSVEPQHMVVSLHRVLRRSRVLAAAVTPGGARARGGHRAASRTRQPTPGPAWP